MGLVYEAEDLSLKRHVALKFLPDRLAADPGALQRFEHEGRLFLVMELLQGESPEVTEVASKLGVSNVLEGSVQLVGERLRVTVQLVSAKDGLQLWSERYDRAFADIFSIQDEIADSVAGRFELDPESSETHSTLGQVGLWYLWDMKASAAHLRRAMELDGSAPGPRARHAWWLSLNGRHEEAVA